MQKARRQVKNGFYDPEVTTLPEDPYEAGISLKARMPAHHNFHDYIKTLRESGTLDTFRSLRKSSALLQSTGFRHSLHKSGLISGKTLTRVEEQKSPDFRSSCISD
jgi:hypothetical protein